MHFMGQLAFALSVDSTYLFLAYKAKWWFSARGNGRFGPEEGRWSVPE